MNKDFLNYSSFKQKCSLHLENLTNVTHGMSKWNCYIQSNTTRKPMECDNDVGQNLVQEEKLSKKLVCLDYEESNWLQFCIISSLTVK